MYGVCVIKGWGLLIVRGKRLYVYMKSGAAQACSSGSPGFTSDAADKMRSMRCPIEVHNSYVHIHI